METKLDVGAKTTLSLGYLVQSGKTDPAAKPDSPPVWAQLNKAAVKMTPSEDGLTADIEALAPGTDTVNVAVVIAGKKYSAMRPVRVYAVPSLLEKVVITATDEEAPPAAATSALTPPPAPAPAASTPKAPAAS